MITIGSVWDKCEELRDAIEFVAARDGERPIDGGENLPLVHLNCLSIAQHAAKISLVSHKLNVVCDDIRVVGKTRSGEWKCGNWAGQPSRAASSLRC